MRFFRFKRRQLPQRTPLVRQRWDMRPKRSSLLKMQQLLKGKVLAAFGIVLASVAILYGFFFTNTLNIRAVAVASEYKDISIENLQKSIAEIVVGKHLAFISMREIEQVVYDQFPEVSSIACQRKLFTRSFECEALGYELVAVIKHENTRYYINENGVVIAFDSRKLGLPIFDLILNPVFADLPAKEEAPPAAEPVLNPVQPEGPPESLTTSVLNAKQNGTATTPEPAPEVAVAEPGLPDPSLLFIRPDQPTPVEPLVLNEEREVFEVAVGKKILDPEELKTILLALKQLEEVLQRKVIEAQYVQVAGELSLTSQPALGGGDGDSADSGDGEKSADSGDDAESAPPTPETDEAPEHEIVVLLDLRRNLQDQFNKLQKSTEVIDFATVKKIDLSIDGEKVFYR